MVTGRRGRERQGDGDRERRESRKEQERNGADDGRSAEPSEPEFRCLRLLNLSTDYHSLSVQAPISGDPVHRTLFRLNTSRNESLAGTPIFSSAHALKL